MLIPPGNFRTYCSLINCFVKPWSLRAKGFLEREKANQLFSTHKKPGPGYQSNCQLLMLPLLTADYPHMHSHMRYKFMYVSGSRDVGMLGRWDVGIWGTGYGMGCDEPPPFQHIARSLIKLNTFVCLWPIRNHAHAHLSRILSRSLYA